MNPRFFFTTILLSLSNYSYFPQFFDIPKCAKYESINQKEIVVIARIIFNYMHVALIIVFIGHFNHEIYTLPEHKSKKKNS